jgi:hypothetical protein
MIGLSTVDQGGALRITTRWPALFSFVAVCFAGRLLLRYTASTTCGHAGRHANRQRKRCSDAQPGERAHC